MPTENRLEGRPQHQVVAIQTYQERLLRHQVHQHLLVAPQPQPPRNPYNRQLNRLTHNRALVRR